MPNKEHWLVPVSVIAESRAKYYSEQDAEKGGLSKSEKEAIYKEEYDYAMDDISEIIDWASNNMDWKDVVYVAIKDRDEPLHHIDYQEGWLNGEKEIVER